MSPKRKRRAGWEKAIIALLATGALALSWTALGAQLGAPSRGENWSTIYRSHQLVVPFGPDAWRAPYNVGTGALMREDYDTAATYLHAAYARVPVTANRKYEAMRQSPECAVRINFSLALEGQGDQQTDSTEAQRLYRYAAQISAPCTSDGLGGGDRDEDRIHQRQRELSGQQQTPGEQQVDPSAQPSAEPDASPSPTPGDQLDDRQSQLEENQRKAEDQRREYDQRKERGFGHGDNW